MLRTLAALLFILGLSACGGVVEEAEPSTEPSTVDALTTPCLSACWGGCQVRDFACRQACEEQCALEGAAPATEEVEALYACPIDRPCPGTTVCVDGLCRDCVRYPHWCAGLTDEVSSMGYPTGCGGFRQRCCEYSACNYGLECDPASRTCLY